MNGSQAKRGANGLRRRCPQCKILRKFCEPDGGNGGEHKPRRPDWAKIMFNEKLTWICGWCIGRANGTIGPKEGMSKLNRSEA